MDDEDFRDRIAQLEDNIEALAEAIERCRKISLAAKFAVTAGAVWLALLILGLVPFAPYALVAALAAVIGGTVLLGSNATTWTQADANLRAAETMRADLIGRVDMRVVGEQTPTLH
ncbi:MAG: hypothetical protein ACREB8_12640 [Pseudolabrys sp.]